MAKVGLTSLTAFIKGRVGNLVYYTRGADTFVKEYQPVVNQPDTPRQIQCRQWMSDLSSHWHDLSDAQQDLWHSYASMHPKKIYGSTAFRMLNLHLLCACHADLGCIYYPPATPGTPKSIFGFSVMAMSPTSNCISWSAPDNANDYVTAHFRLNAWFCCVFPAYGLCPTDGYRPHFRFIETVRSDVSQIVQTHSWPGGARLYFKVRSIDKSGRQSPYSHTIRITVPDA